MATIGKFEDITAWQKAREMTYVIYEFSSQGNFARDYSLKDQIRRSSSSVMSELGCPQRAATFSLICV